MADPYDRTINQSGPSNMTPTAERIAGGWVENLVDGFIKGKWMPPEARENEIAMVYKANLKTADRDFSEYRAEVERAEYARGWIDRVQSDD